MNTKTFSQAHFILFSVFVFTFFSITSEATLNHKSAAEVINPKPVSILADSTTQSANTLKEKIEARMRKTSSSQQASLLFDIPVTYNKRVSYWISYFQDNGKDWFRGWLERSTRFMPFIQSELRKAGLPQDLGFMVMIESGFLPNAISHAQAVGPWQFIAPTGRRYGLEQQWWLDERRDLAKSTEAATKYLRDLFEEFGSWYLVAASYNMGEGGLRRQIKKYRTRDFWALAQMGALPRETTDYVPKIIAAMMIAKSPSLYGFMGVSQFEAFDFDEVTVPGGTDLREIAEKIGVTTKTLRDLNAELIHGYIPSQVKRHTIRVPKGAGTLVALKVSSATRQ
jgi:membrane-bound lytic murein transglycosylase D